MEYISKAVVLMLLDMCERIMASENDKKTINCLIKTIENDKGYLQLGKQEKPCSENRNECNKND